MIAIRAMLVDRPVQDQAHVTQFAFAVELLHFGKGTAIHPARTDDIDRQVGTGDSGPSPGVMIDMANASSTISAWLTPYAFCL